VTEYVCGHSVQEFSRLELQGAFFEAITRRTFERAGLVRGMRVLDLGCGAGDVSLLVADMVGATGEVIGVDRSAAAVEAAAARAARLGVRHAMFQVAELGTLMLDTPVDAVVGRFVLMHQNDPATALGAAVRHVRPGGIVAMIESHMQAAVPAVHSWPLSPTYAHIMQWMIAVIEASGARADMGLELRRTFVAAGLAEPSLALEARVEGGRDAEIYRYTVESVRSMMPAAKRLGIASIPDDELATLESRLRDEVVSSGGVLTSPLIVSAWCRTGQL
jgi:ubiquinone/menaquinone biosynthesis C-methylase UbiE